MEGVPILPWLEGWCAAHHFKKSWICPKLITSIQATVLPDKGNGYVSIEHWILEISTRLPLWEEWAVRGSLNGNMSVSYLPRSPYTCEVWYCGIYCVAMSPAPVTGEYIWRGGGGIMVGRGMKPGRGECGGLCITAWLPGWNSGAWGTTTTLRTPLSSITCTSREGIIYQLQDCFIDSKTACISWTPQRRDWSL